MKAFAPLLVAIILLLGCRKDIQNKEAIRLGVADYFAKRPDLTAMDIQVSSVTFRQNEADAVVYLTAKGSPGGGMQMRYTLERKDNRWVVKPRSAAAPGSGNPHGGAVPSSTPEMALPLPLPGAVPNGSALPPGHPQFPAPSPGKDK